ncbi:MAG TPA: efflux RND transporter periplasmic adaptor subunit [Gammaproteobacteria bacterium]|jgi:cobalt-zinc-cadmium efflux system membrane fusion protein|nr:efflux RND transporter periplasmic adaptor subunit [Gammaproteobacteria bacterium]|tara:strand:- start:45 stop:1265 length:1221 start_codon:yes stop_codon:yes gene_type:complete
MKLEMKRGIISVLLGACLIPLSVPLAQEADQEEETPTGNHGGRLLVDGGFAVELAIFEQGVPPEYRAWATNGDSELAPGDWQLTVELSRLGGQVDHFSFSATDDFKLGAGVVAEPHSFDVSVTANYQGRIHSWQFESHEGRVEMSPELAKAMGIGVYVAGAQLISQTELLYGNISPDPTQVSHITARYPGLIQSVNLRLGDTVSQGQLIATVEANDSLQTYEIRAPISGIVVDSHANPGEYAGEQPLLTIVNYQNVWADLNVFPGEAQRIRPGQEVNLRMGELTAVSTIRYLNPGEGLSPHVIARVPLANPDLLWTPGLLVEADVTVDQFEVSLAVDNRALQSFRDWQVVFIQIGDSYEIRPLELGRTNGRFTEVLGGFNAGDRYVVENSYLLKADLEKSGATHDH